MTLKELNLINKDKSFAESRLMTQKDLLIGLTIGGCVVIALWHFFDAFYQFPNPKELFWLRVISILIFNLNILVALFRGNKNAYRQHLIAGFYFGTAYCMLLSMFTGASASPYWYSLFFVLLAWFVLMPYNYQELLMHGVVFCIMFNLGSLSQRSFHTTNEEIFRIFFLYSGTLFIGAFSAISKNRSDAINFLSKSDIKETSRNLLSANEELQAEIEHHTDTAKRLSEKQQFIDNILSNAPIVIWSVDLEGRFTFSQGKGLQKLDLTPEGRIGKSALEIYEGTPVASFVQRVIKGEATNEIIFYKNWVFDTRVSPLFNSAGEKTGYMGISVDIADRVRAEKSLAKFKLVLDQAPGAVMIIDKNNCFEYLNPNFTKISGYTEEDLLHKDIKATLYNGRVPESRIEITSTIQSGKAWQGELLTRKKNGDLYWANTIAAPYTDTDGNFDGYIVIQQDITARKNIENALKESEELYRTLIEKTQDGIAITQDGKFMLTNTAFEQMMGYAKEDFKNLGANEILDPEDRQRVVDIHFRRMRGEIGTFNYTATLLHKSGRKITGEFNSTTISYGGKNASFITIRDITERLTIEMALRESEQKYKTLVENSQDGILIVRMNKILFANNTFCKMLGCDCTNLYSHPSTDFIYPEDRVKAMKVSERRQTGDTSTTHEHYRLVRSDGELIECETYSSVIDYEGEIASFFTIHDITESRRMQEALSKSEKKYRQLTELLPQAIYELDIKGNPTFMNEAGKKTFGITKDMKDKKAFEFFVPQDMERMKEVLAKESQNLIEVDGELWPKASEPVEYTAKRVDGSTFPVIIYGTPIVEDGKVVGSRGMIIDISERKRMETELRESEKKYKTLVENSQDGICVTQNGRFKYVNKSFCLMLGYKADELYQINVIDIVEPSYQRQFAVLTESRDNGLDSVTNYSIQLIRKDKRIIDVSIESTFTEFEGKPASFDTVHDITESKRIQAALMESEAKYRELVEKTNSIILIWDNKFNITFLNEYGLQFFGYTKDEIIDKSMEGTIVPKTEQTSGRNLKELMKQIFDAPENFAHNINENMCKNGDRVWVSWNNTAIKDDSGNIVNMFSVGTDITARRRNEEELRITKDKLQKLNQNLEKQINETAQKLTEANTQLIRLQKENLQSQFEVLRQQVNPHFLFNSLNVLTSLIKLEPDLAEKFTEHLSKVYRYVLENKDNDLVSLRTELDFLDAYLFLLNIRFMDKIKVEISIEEDKKEFLILPLALQLIIENAIKHNTMSKKAPLIIQLFIDIDLMLNIINNLQERESHMISTGVGLKNITHRYELLELPAPQFFKTDKEFIAKIPLKKNN